MPQLDPSHYPSELFWLLITFVALYFVVVRAALPRISEVLEARQEKIDDDLKAAAARKEEAEAVWADYEEAQRASHARAHDFLKSAQADMNTEATQQNDALTARLTEQAVEAEKRIQGAKQQALENLNQTVAEVAAAATAKLIGDRPSEDQVNKAVADVMEGGK
ncbi:MAG: F0F1 ATP synthase subunit B' [Pseudomonadota bacterium]